MRLLAVLYAFLLQWFNVHVQFVCMAVFMKMVDAVYHTQSKCRDFLNLQPVLLVLQEREKRKAEEKEEREKKKAEDKEEKLRQKLEKEEQRKKEKEEREEQKRKEKEEKEELKKKEKEEKEKKKQVELE